MCGIVGYLGAPKKASFIVEKLKKLEYRGYDSSGLANMTEAGVQTIKAVGNISKLEEKVPEDMLVTSAIAHTRWATHGVPSEVNAHPHTGTSGGWTIVHNGIIENFLEIKNSLPTGASILSDTDTAVVAELLEADGVHDIDGFVNACKKLTGSYAFLAMNKNIPNTLFLARNKSPLYCAIKNGNVLVASDPICLVGFSEDYFQLENGEFALVTNSRIEFFNNRAEKVVKTKTPLDEILEDSGKGDYPHFMLKEIMEERAALNRIVKSYTDNNVFTAFDKERLSAFDRVEFIGCGTAHHAGLMGARYIELVARIPASATVASEFIYMDPIVNPRTLYVFVSQSGETADTLRAMELVKSHGCTTIAVTNVLYSSLSKSVDFVFPVCAGPEIAVASTKAYVSQIAVLYCFARHIKNVLTGGAHDFLANIKQVSEVILSFDKKTIEKIADELKSKTSCIYIGKDLDSITASESALKLKEIAYIEANSYPSGELKHGFLALVEEGTFIFVLANKKCLNSKTYNATHEAISRGAKAVLVGHKSEDNFTPAYHIDLPEMDELLLPLVSIAPMQYLAYLVSISKGINPDQPRNLAKSVTVE